MWLKTIAYERFSFVIISLDYNFLEPLTIGGWSQTTVTDTSFPINVAFNCCAYDDQATTICLFLSLKQLKDGDKQGHVILDQMLDEWRRRLSVVQSDVRTIEPLLRLRRILLQQTKVIKFTV